MNPDVGVLFLPAYTRSLIQLIDQTVISTFKSYYLKHVMKAMVDSTKITQDDSVVVVENFWKKFSILDAIDYVKKSWKEVKNATLNRSWYNTIRPTIGQFASYNFI